MMRLLRHTSILVLCAALARPTLSGAQRPSADSAAAQARTALWAMAHGDFRTVASRTDPAELRSLRADFDSLLRADSSNYIAMRLFRMDSTAQLRRLDDMAFAAGLMAFTFGINPSLRQLATITDIDIPGVVQRAPDTALVVYRWIYPKDSLQTAFYNVARMVRCGGSWCAQVPGNLRGMLELLKQPMVRVQQPTVTRRPDVR